MKIGIFGGSFDPITMAHLYSVEYLREHNKLDKILFVPAKKNPLKEEAFYPTQIRYLCVALAIEDNPHFDISSVDVTSDEENYTVNTIEKLKKIHDKDELFLIMGDDVDITTFKDYEKIDIPVLVMKRDNFLSSTLIRERLQKNETIKYLVPSKVEHILKTFKKESK